MNIWPFTPRNSLYFPLLPIFISPSFAETETLSQLKPPAHSQYDWLQLKSNELLKGKIKSLHQNKLEFDSDNLNTLSISWDKVKMLQSAGVVSIGFTDFSTRSGRLLIDNNQCTLAGTVCTRSDIITIIAGEQSEANYWSGKISLGVNIRSGNTDQVDYSAQAKATRRTTQSSFHADYLGNYTKNDGQSTVNNHRINTNFDWFISKGFFLRPVFTELYKDPFLNIDYKASLGAGIGYNIIDTSDSKWSISGGPAYTYTRFDQVENNASKSENSASVVLDTQYNTKFTDDIDFSTTYRLQYGNQMSGGYTHHAIASLEVKLTDMFALDLSTVWDHINKPQPDSNGQIPDKNDYRFIIGFGVKL